MPHQIQIERQLFEGQLLEHSEHIFTALGRDEEVGVFDAGRNAFDGACLSKIELRDPVGEFIQTDRSKNCHEKYKRKGGIVCRKITHLRALLSCRCVKLSNVCQLKTAGGTTLIFLPEQVAGFE